jgi:hypothetical protein
VTRLFKTSGKFTVVPGVRVPVGVSVGVSVAVPVGESVGVSVAVSVGVFVTGNTADELGVDALSPPSLGIWP